MVHQDCHLALLIGGSLCGLAGVGITTKPGCTLVCWVPVSLFAGTQTVNLTLGSFISLLVLSSSVSTGEQKCMEVWRWILHKPWSLSAPQSQAGVPCWKPGDHPRLFSAWICLASDWSAAFRSLLSKQSVEGRTHKGDEGSGVCLTFPGRFGGT